MNKKTLREVFGLFDNAKWVTQVGTEITFHGGKKRPIAIDGYQNYYGAFQWIGRVDGRLLKIDWGSRKTWKQRCVSREEVMGE